MAIVRFISGQNQNSVTTSTRGLNFLKKVCDEKSTPQDIRKACCQAGICPVILAGRHNTK